MKVLIIGGSLPPKLRYNYDCGGGYSKAVWNIASSIASYEKNVSVYYLPFHFNNITNYNKLQIFKVRINNVFNLKHLLGFHKSFKQVIPFINLKSFLKSYPRNIVIFSTLKKILSKNEFDLINVHGITPYFFTIFDILKETNSKILLTLHGINSSDENIKTDFSKEFELFGCRKYLNINANISTVSSFTSRELETLLNLPQDAVYSVENAIDKSYFDVSIDVQKKNREYVRSNLNLADDDIIALSVGSLNKLKSQNKFIELMPHLKEKKVKYFLVGSGEQKENLLKLSKKLGVEKDVYFLGNQNISEIVKIYDAGDFLVHLPTSEGFGLVFAEALARGLPILTYKYLPFSRKYLSEDYAELIDNDKKERLLSACLKLIHKIECNSFNKEKIMNLADKFKPEKMANNYFDLFKTIISTK